jgi:predicted Zn-dependent peptidase
MNIYMVSLHTGEYEDRYDKVIKAFSKKKNANKFAKELENMLDAMRRHSKGNNEASENLDSRYDSAQFMGFRIDYNGACVSISSPIKVEDCE